MKRKLLIIVADLMAAILSYGCALWLRFDFRMSDIGTTYMTGYGYYIPLAAIVTFMIYMVFRLYNSIWSYAGLSDA